MPNMAYNFMKNFIFLFIVSLFSQPLLASVLAVQPVTKNVYALVGEIDARTVENLGLNNTLGFVVTTEGVVLLGSGGWAQAAQAIEKAIQSVTDLPIVLVVNAGVQDHYWMGNDYFLQQGIPVLALQKTLDNQKRFQAQNRQRLQMLLSEALPPPRTADRVIAADRYDFIVGETEFSLRYLGDGHFPGDAVLWLPTEKVLFSGDFVFNERILGIHPEITDVAAWQETFLRLKDLQATWVIPGHGRAGDWATAQQSSGDYLDWLLSQVGQAIENMEDLEETLDRLEADSPFTDLLFHEAWHRRNVFQTYLQLEAAF